MTELAQNVSVSVGLHVCMNCMIARISSIKWCAYKQMIASGQKVHVCNILNFEVEVMLLCFA